MGQQAAANVGHFPVKSRLPNIPNRGDAERFAALRTPIWVFDVEDHRMWWANASAVKFWQARSLEELLARDYSTDSETTRLRLRQVVENTRSGEAVMDTWTLYPNGKPVTVILTMSPLTIEDDRAAVLIESSAPLDLQREPEALRILEAARYTPLQVSTFSLDGRLLCHNPAAAEAFGQLETGLYPDHEPGLGDRLVSRRDAEELLATCRQGKSFQRDLRVATAQGLSWHHVDARRGRDPLTGADVIVITEEDISERKAAEKKLRDQIGFLQTVIDFLPIGIYVKDPNDRYQIVNKAFLDLFGMHSSNIIGRADEELFEAHIAEALSGSRTGKVRRIEQPEFQEVQVKINGTERYLHIGRTAIRVGRREHVLGFAVDVTAQRTAEKRANQQRHFLQKLIETDPNLIFVRNAAGDYLFANKAMKRLMDKGLCDMPPEDSGARPSLLLSSRLSEAEQQVLGDMRTITRDEEVRLSDGSKCWYKITRTPLSVSESEYNVLAVGVDITAEKQAEAELATLNRTLEQRVAERTKELHAALEEAELANRSKTDFLAAMSHELRTPLNAIIGFTDLLESGVYGAMNERQHVAIADINQSGRLLYSLISDLLDAAKLDAGHVHLYETEVKLVRVIEESIAMLRPASREKDIELTVDCSESLSVYADQVKLKQIILNILSNGVKFTPANGEIRAHVRAIPKGDLCIAISDTGLGIPQDRIPEALEPFSQIDSTPTNGHSGAGLGLYIVKNLIELHDGSIEIESELGQGTEVRVYLPGERILSM